MTAANETFTCPECYKEISRGGAIDHANAHWSPDQGFTKERLSKEGKDKLAFVRDQQSRKGD